ncbi:MAG TPA: hypothetical protein VGJ20_07965 [Xanthobacteraceae bacterium]|jgi:hypothetical protein
MISQPRQHAFSGSVAPAVPSAGAPSPAAAKIPPTAKSISPSAIIEYPDAPVSIDKKHAGVVEFQCRDLDVDLIQLKIVNG